MTLFSRRFGLVAALAVGLAAPAFAQAPAAAPVRGGALTIGVESDFEGFDPIRAGVYSNSTVTAASLFYETLMRLDDKGNLLPALALSMTPNEDGSVWTAKIRPNVKVPRRQPIHRPVGGRPFQSPARSGQPFLRARLSCHREGRGTGRPDRGLQDARSQRRTSPDAGAAYRDHADHFGEGRPGEGRRLQSQSGRHRPVRLQGMACRRPADRRSQPRLPGTRTSPISTG